MPLRAEQLSAALQQSLQSIYLISGDETLLVEEACDVVLAKAREQGFTERSIHHVESGFKWHDVINDAASMSLFAERKVLEKCLRLLFATADLSAVKAQLLHRLQVDHIAIIFCATSVSAGRAANGNAKFVWNTPVAYLPSSRLVPIAVSTGKTIGKTAACMRPWQDSCMHTAYILQVLPGTLAGCFKGQWPGHA